jgi:CBS domain-containing protein
MKIQTILATKGTKVHTVRPAQSLKEIVALLARHNVGALVVVDDADRPVGIISERDIIRAAARGEDFTRPVSAAMTRTIVVGSPQDDVASVMKTMTERRFRHLPIIENGKLVGIVSIGDMVKAQLEQYQGEIETLETQIIGG